MEKDHKSSIISIECNKLRTVQQSDHFAVARTAGPAGRYGAPFEETIAALLLLILLLLLLVDDAIDATVGATLVGARSIDGLSRLMCAVGVVTGTGAGAAAWASRSMLAAVVPLIAGVWLQVVVNVSICVVFAVVLIGGICVLAKPLGKAVVVVVVAALLAAASAKKTNASAWMEPNEWRTMQRLFYADLP